ncbi:MAG: gliding motility lipoprotein GldH [Bacteroidales bacterium]|nr:gliding motility lipoprotein GldH [Bacteroidales bacterium]
MKRIIKPLNVIPVLLVMLLVSCSSGVLFDQTANVDGHWYKDNPKDFEVMVPDSLTTYNFYLNVRHTRDYGYSNLYLFLQTRFPNGHITRDTLQLILANNAGKWLGKGWGSVKEDQILLKRNLRFPMKGNYEFTIWQAMRADTLKGVRNIGLRFVRSN